jgi:hypothetical protein
MNTQTAGAQTQNSLTKQKFDEILSNYIESEREYIAEHEAVKEILKPLEGKEINGRTLNANRLGEFKFKAQYGMFYISGKHEHLIGYQKSYGYGKNEAIISIEANETTRGFEYFDNCHGSAAKARIAQIENCNREKIYALFAKIEFHFNALRELFSEVESSKAGSYDFAPYYSVLNSIYKEENNHSLKLTDFYHIRK